MPKVSVIVPVYNAEKYLSRCIDSILNQTYKDFELILVNDGSHDNSGAICDEYAEKDERIKVVHKKNGGPSSARNCGIDYSGGEFVMFVDSDDYIEPDMLETHYNLMEKNVELTVTSMDTLGEKKTTKQYLPNKVYTTLEYLDDLSKNIFAEICAGGPYCKFFVKNILDRYDVRFRIGMSLGEDTCFNMEYLRYCKRIATSDKILYHYVKENEGSLFSKFQENTYSNVKTAFECRLETLKYVSASKEIIDNFTEMYVEYMLANVVKSVKKGTKQQAVEYIKQAQQDGYFNKVSIKHSMQLRILDKTLKNIKSHNIIYCIVLALLKFKNICARKD